MLTRPRAAPRGAATTSRVCRSTRRRSGRAGRRRRGPSAARRERDRQPTHRVNRQLDHLPAVDVEPVPQVGEPRSTSCASDGRQTGDLDGQDRLLVAVRAADHDDVAPACVRHQQQRPAQAGCRAAGTGGQVDQVGSRRPHRPEPVAVHQLLQARRLVVRGQGDAVDRDLATGLARPAVEGDLEVDLLEHRELVADHGLRPAGRTEVLLHGAGRPGCASSRRRRRAPRPGTRGPPWRSGATPRAWRGRAGRSGRSGRSRRAGRSSGPPGHPVMKARAHRSRHPSSSGRSDARPGVRSMVIGPN